MAQVKAFTVPGVRMIFPSGDHEPPHFHAGRPGVWKAKVFFLNGRDDMFANIKPPGAIVRPADRRAIIEGAQAHRADLLVEWEACQSG